ncbi:hypothetical protein F0M18_12460 [Pseudohalioglobus sediminis]|uniref:Lipopolysaccharide kinase (Kdo/WaaP) family protein n=1 Tax=Pseudohalioglobus sediminis TaxID=2606449 RepID=A0A5B0WUP8_9GAMM|nr:lipopolysaccharide kinase InaA family protein [Pseudohalioglobus sediminis]KAA1190616.1 hypothetical protein F0M18_12460 [Pseudohalioglobus sediminis]
MTAAVLRGGAEAFALADVLPGGATASWLAENGRVLKRDDHSLVTLLEHAGQLRYCKYFAAKHLLQRVAFRFGLGRAVRAFDAARLLQDRDIPVPAPLACLRRQDGLLLVTEGLRGALDIKAIWLDESTRAWRQRVLDNAGSLLAQLHSAGFAHGDCKWSNLLWQGEQLFLVDLEAVEQCARGHGQQSRDLARFTVNAEDLGVDSAAYRQFLEVYCGAMGESAADVAARIQPHLARFRARHLEKYGERGARLL